MIQNLPQDARPLSGNIYIDGSGMLWTGVAGGFIAFTPKSYVDESIEDIDITVTPADLGITDPHVSGWRIPAVQNSGFIENGLEGTVSRQSSERYTLAIRDNGRLSVNDAVGAYDAVNRRQAEELSRDQQNEGNNTIPTVGQVRVQLSRDIRVRPEGSQIFVTNSRSSEIESDVHTSFMIGSRNSKIGGQRINTGIIGSDNCEIERYVQGGGGGIQPKQYKWNSVIIASLNSRMRPHVSYGLLTGQGTVSTGSATVTIGLYNIIDPDRSVTDLRKKTFVIGNGGNTEAFERSNAFYVTHGGKAWIQNELEVDSPNGVVLRSPDGSRFRLQVDNNGNINTTKL